MDRQVPIEGEESFPGFGQGVVDLSVRRRIDVLTFLGAGSAEDHPAGVVVALEGGDVGVIEKEIADRPGFRMTEGIVSGTVLDVFGLPAGGPVSVEVVATGSVLVDPAIAVVVSNCSILRSFSPADVAFIARQG